jgi:hypothetical protein
MSSAPPPYRGARTNRLAISLIDWLPSSHSATSGERRNNPSAGATRRSIRGRARVSWVLMDVVEVRMPRRYDAPGPRRIGRRHLPP